MDVVVVIPARWASERLPGKPLADIAGKPMVVRVLERARAARGVRAAVVATDDERIAQAVQAAGGVVVMTPPDCPTGTDRCARAALELGRCDVVVNVQGDEPLLDPGAIEQVVAPFEDPQVEMATLARPLGADELGNPNVVKVACDLAGRALYFSRAPIGKRREGAEGGSRAHVGIYAYRYDFLQTFATFKPTPLEKAERLEQLRALEHGHKIRVVDTDYASFGVDTPEDLERVRSLVSQFQKEQP